MDRLERYREYRAVGKALNSRMLESYLTEAILRKSAELLGLRDEDGELVYDREADVHAHQEFALKEYRWADGTAVERFEKQESWETEMEKTVLDGMLRADTSLFRVTSVDEPERRLVVADLLSDEAGIELTDVGLSETVDSGMLLFFRLVPYAAFNMTSGVTLPFAGRREEHLLNVYDQVSERVTSRPASVTRFVSFYKLHKKYGLDIRQLDPP